MNDYDTLNTLLDRADNGEYFTAEELMATNIFENTNEIEVFFICVKCDSCDLYTTEKGYWSKLINYKE